MLTVVTDSALDAVFIEFEDGPAGYSEELDENRIVDYSLNPGTPVGVCLHNVSDGVKLEGLPHQDQVRQILAGLGVEAS